MDTWSAHHSVLVRILDALAAEIFHPDLYNRLNIAAENYQGGDTLPLQEKYDESVCRLIENLSSVIVIPDLAIKRLKEEPLFVQVAFFERYLFAKDVLSWNNNAIFTVPKSLDKLFKWFYIDFWNNHGY